MNGISAEQVTPFGQCAVGKQLAKILSMTRQIGAITVEAPDRDFQLPQVIISSGMRFEYFFFQN